jgi:hypothetical protein
VITGSTADGSLRPALRRAAPRTLRRALAAPRSRSAMHAIDDVRVDDFVDGFGIAQFRWAKRDLGLSPYIGKVVILIPGATAAVVLRRPVPRSRADSPIWRISSIARIPSNRRSHTARTCPVGRPRPEKKTATRGSR